MLAGVREVGDEAIHERFAEVLAPVRDELLERLTPREGDRLLDELPALQFTPMF